MFLALKKDQILNLMAMGNHPPAFIVTLLKEIAKMLKLFEKVIIQPWSDPKR